MTSMTTRTNLASVDEFMNADIDAEFAYLREHEPIAWHQHPDCGRGFWSITRFDHLAEASKNTADFSNREGVRLNYDPEKGLKTLSSGSMLEMDPPEHTRFRKLAWAPFAPLQVKKLTEDIRERCRVIVESVVDRGEAEFVFEIADRLPINVISDMCSIPESDREWVGHIANVSFGSSDPELVASPEVATQAVQDLRAYALKIIEEHRSKPKDDLFQRLVDGNMEGEKLSDDELVVFFTLLMAGGIETTRNTLAHGIDAFTKFPEQKAILLADPEGTIKTTVDEVLRWGSPVHSQKRIVTRDLDFHGVQMKEGDKVALWFRSGNRDESTFENADTFDVRRAPNPHMAFGSGGPHFCLGAHLARLELTQMFLELFRVMPNIHATGELVKVEGNQFHGIKRLDVAW